MKTRLFAIAVGLASGLGLGSFHAFADLEVSAEISIHANNDFYQPLAARGAWVEVGSYGRCWHPAGVASGWRPYCQGEWEWTDCGWYWVSDEPWAWACYHYGTWVLDSNYGWVWVPGVEWAPAWVNWRTGGDYIGWAPCGPSGFIVEPTYFVFVQNRHFHDHFRPNTVIINNTTIIRETREIRSVSREQRPVNGRSQTVVVNNGPGVSVVAKATGHKFSATPVQKLDQSTVRKAPAELRHRPTDSKFQPQQQQQPQHFTEPQSKTSPQETPRNIPPKQEVMPDDRHIPDEHKVAPIPEKTIPERTIPNQRVIPDRVVPEMPAQKLIPPSHNEIPRDKGERPRELIPPTQPTHPVIPVTPGNAEPNEKGYDHGNGNEHKDRNQDHP